MRYKDNTVNPKGTIAKVFVNNVETMSQPITSVSAPNVGGLLSLYAE